MWVSTWLPQPFCQCISFATILQANFGCHWFKFMPEIPAFAQWAPQSLHMKFEPEQTSSSWTGSWSRSAALDKIQWLSLPKNYKAFKLFDSTESVLQVNAQKAVARGIRFCRTFLQVVFRVQFSHVRVFSDWKCVRFSHVRVLSDSCNVQKSVTQIIYLGPLPNAQRPVVALFTQVQRLLSNCCCL